MMTSAALIAVTMSFALYTYLNMTAAGRLHSSLGQLGTACKQQSPQSCHILSISTVQLRVVNLFAAVKAMNWLRAMQHVTQPCVSKLCKG